MGWIAALGMGQRAAAVQHPARGCNTRRFDGITSHYRLRKNALCSGTVYAAYRPLRRFLPGGYFSRRAGSALGRHASHALPMAKESITLQNRPAAKTPLPTILALQGLFCRSPGRRWSVTPPTRCRWQKNPLCSRIVPRRKRRCQRFLRSKDYFGQRPLAPLFLQRSYHIYPPLMPAALKGRIHKQIHQFNGRALADHSAAQA